MELKGRKIFKGNVEGEVLKADKGISFYGGVDADTGIVTQKGHSLEGQNISGKILVFPQGTGSTVGSYTLYQLKKNGKAPKAIVNKECETIVAVGCIISEIPCVDKIAIENIKTGDKVSVDAENGIVEIKG